MWFLVRLTLSALRIATHTSLFLELQRVLLRIVRPTPRDHLRRLESHILSSVNTPHTHLHLPCSATGEGDTLHALYFPPSTPTKTCISSTWTCNSPIAKAIPKAPASKGNLATQTVAVLLHGHSMSSTYWYRNIDDLASLGYPVLAIDLLGWGHSSRPSSCRSTTSATAAIEWYTSSLTAALSAFSSSPQQRYLLIGHSLGAYVALEYAKKNPRQIEQLVLVSPAACVRPIPVPRALYFLLTPQRLARRAGLLGYLLFVHKYPRTNSYNAHRLRDYTYHLSLQPAGGEFTMQPLISFATPTTAFCTRPLVDHLHPTLPTSIPVQLVVGALDSSMPAADVHMLYAAMRSAGYNVRLTVVPDSDHCPQLERPKHFFGIIFDITKTRLPSCPSLRNTL